LLGFIITLVLLALVIAHWELIDAAFVNVLENAAGQFILPAYADFKEGVVILHSGTTT